MSLPPESPLDDREAQLLRNLLGTAAHDLGGLASALSLRAESLTGDDGRALAAIADELRILGRQLRQLRGPSGAEQLAPVASGALLPLFVLLERFGRGVLGRGFTLVAHGVDHLVAPLHADALLYGLLAVLHAVRDADMALPAVVQVRALTDSAHVRVTVHVSGADGGARTFPLRQMQWIAVAERFLSRAGLLVTHHAGGMDIVVPAASP